MRCLHPRCPMGSGLADWNAVITSQEANIREPDRERYALALASCGSLATMASPAINALIGTAPFRRLLELCPCLFAQVNVKVSAAGVVHLCEITLGTKIVSTNVYDAFEIQHPRPGTPAFTYPPIHTGASGGDIMETLCSEVLANHGVPHMKLDPDGWPEWQTQAHVSLNKGKLRALKLFGDILIPAAPHNLLISVKSEAARERFVVSGNRLESIGFGFFSDPNEFWTTSRMNLLKRWGFSAIYLPAGTLELIQLHLTSKNTSSHAININGHPLFRPLAEFGPDMAKHAGRLSLDI